MPAWPYSQRHALGPQRDLPQGVVELLVRDDRAPARGEERVVGAAQAVVAPRDLAGGGDDQRAVVVAVGDQHVPGKRARMHRGQAECDVRRIGARLRDDRLSRRAEGRGRGRRRGRGAAAGERCDRGGAEQRDQPTRARITVPPGSDVVEPGMGEGVGLDRDHDSGHDCQEGEGDPQPASVWQRIHEVGGDTSTGAQRVGEDVDRHHTDPDDEARLVQHRDGAAVGNGEQQDPRSEQRQGRQYEHRGDEHAHQRSGRAEPDVFAGRPRSSGPSGSRCCRA